MHADEFRYEDPRRRSLNSVFCRSFVCVQRGSKTLSYRLGRYREDNAFVHRRSIGFTYLVHSLMFTLFNQADFGIVNLGVRATKTDLDIPEVPIEIQEDQHKARLSHFIWVVGPEINDLLAVICFECPSWFDLPSEDWHSTMCAGLTTLSLSITSRTSTLGRNGAHECRSREVQRTALCGHRDFAPRQGKGDLISIADRHWRQFQSQECVAKSMQVLSRWSYNPP